jgi:SHO1 osmosensor
LYTLASDSIAMHRFQISTFGAVAIVFAVTGVDIGIFANAPAPNAMAAGWLILAMVDILWVLYFTSEEDSLALHIFNSLGTGGLTPPSRRRRNTRVSVHNAAQNGGYSANYSPGGGIGSHDVPYETKMGSGVGSGGLGAGMAQPGMRSQNSFGGASRHDNTSIGGTGVGSPAHGGAGSLGGDNTIGPSSPLMGSGAAGLGSGGGPGSNPAIGDIPNPDTYS